MRQLLSTFRIIYIRNKDEKGCVFCSKQKSNNDKNSLILSRGNHSFVLMNLYPYNNAHLLITPYNHVDTTDQLDIDTLNEIIWFANESMIIMKKNLNTDGYNFGANIGAAGGAGIEDHIHFHVVPRWNGDTNFMPVIGETKVQVQGLQDTYSELKIHFDKIMDKN